MIYISHRGNINGPNSSKENHPDYIKEAIKLGYQVELDVWVIGNKYSLGHNAPQYEIDKSFLYNNKMWCHAKNMETITELTSRGNLMHCFFHDTDDCTLTSRGWIWTYPGKPILGRKAIAVVPERSPKWMISLAGGICSDYVQDYQKNINFTPPK
jgi:hypothetical protein